MNIVPTILCGAARGENPCILDLVVLEVQAGEYVGEDDIVRFQDRYGCN